MDFFPTVSLIVDDLRRCGWSLKRVDATHDACGVRLRPNDIFMCYSMSPPNSSENVADTILFRQAQATSQWCEVYAVSWYKAGSKGSIFMFDSTASSQQVQDALLGYFTDFAPHIAPAKTKVWTLQEACEQNKTRQQCCVCGKPTVRMELCLSTVQYCRCIESLKS